jgi:LPS-assembly protein
VDALKELFESMQSRIEFEPPNHYRFLGQVDLPIPGQTATRVFADQVDFFLDTNQLVAVGNVSFTSTEGRINAERIEFNLLDGTATFYDASGIVTLPDANRAEFANQEPDVIFWGNRIDKLGPKKYRITQGGFSTCVQPTPRWEVTSKSIDLNLDDHALARSMVLRVKGVPLLYLPAIYYPLHDEQRSTGFLLPTYGTSTLRGTSISNGFFWAMGRSHDATFFHDWFARAGQGAGAEYRYVVNAGSSGEVRAYRFDQQQNLYASDGDVNVLPATTSYEVRGNMVHRISPAMTVRGRAEWASNLLTQQLYQQSVYRASNPVRVVEGGFTGTWGALSTTALYQRSEVFSTAAVSTLSGNAPRVTGAIAPTQLFGMPIYGSVLSEYAYQPYRTIVNGATTYDNSLAHYELAPSVRVPLSRLTYLTLNTTASYRTTYFNRSLNAAGVLINEPIGRSYFAARSDIIGPVFTKIWDTPNSAVADRMKHVIEPTFAVDYVTDITNAAQLPSLSHVSDVVVGGSARLTYGLTNRLFLRSRPTGTVNRGTSREYLTIGVQQTYYSDPEASRWDYQYAGASSRGPNDLVELSPIALTTRFTPNAVLSANSRLEYDVSGTGLQSVSLGGSISAAAATATVGYSRVRYTPTYQTNSLNLSNTMRFLNGRMSGTYSLYWDIERSYVVNQGLTASYLAQCCGVQLEYQQYNYPDTVGFPINADRRINFGVVLAGLGTFSNFFGAFGGQP